MRRWSSTEELGEGGRRGEGAGGVAETLELDEGLGADAFGFEGVEDAVVEALGGFQLVQRLGEVGVLVVILDSCTDERDDFRYRRTVLCRERAQTTGQD
jgi:hypothetical protein